MNTLLFFGVCFGIVLLALLVMPWIAPLVGRYVDWVDSVMERNSR